jgi:hypothetical protein
VSRLVTGEDRGGRLFREVPAGAGHEAIRLGRRLGQTDPPAPAGAVRVRGEHVGERRSHQPLGEAPLARAARRARQCERRHLRQVAPLDQGAHALRLALERRIALRVREQRSEAARVEVEQQLLEQLADLAVRRLNQ